MHFNNDLIIRKQSQRYPELSVLKYHRKVFYDNLWTDELEEARGHVVDQDGNIVALPFRKIYNYGVEARAPKLSLDEVVYWQRKINGFMLAVSLYKDELLFSTTGSLDSDFVDMGRSMFDSEQLAWLKSRLQTGPSVNVKTILFEIVHPDDPHIIPEQPGAYLLATRGVGELQRPFVMKHAPFLMPQNGMAKFDDVLQEVKLVQHEGFVIYTYDGKQSTKIKSPFYLFNKFVARTSGEKILNLRKSHVDEEFYSVVDWIDSNREWFAALDEQSRLRELRAYFTAMVK